MQDSQADSTPSGAAATAQVETCAELGRIHSDFQELVKAHCLRCNGGEGYCLVARLSELVRNG